jgi:hypothetical protein
MTADQVGQAIFAGNDVMMQWYALTHQVTIPGPGTITMNPESGSLQVGSGILVLGALLVIGAIFLLRD